MKRVFLSYSSPEASSGADVRRLVEQVAARVPRNVAECLWDGSVLENGQAYNQPLLEAAATADVFVFFANESALRDGSYALSELRAYLGNRTDGKDTLVLSYLLDVGRRSLPKEIRDSITARDLREERGDRAALVAYELTRKLQAIEGGLFEACCRAVWAKFTRRLDDATVGHRLLQRDTFIPIPLLNKQEKPVEARSLLDPGARSVILGRGGSGKSTLSRYLAWDSQRVHSELGKGLLPILVRLEDLDPGSELWDYSIRWIREAFHHRRSSSSGPDLVPVPEAGVLRDSLNQWAQEGRLALLLDGLNEGQSDKLLERFQSQEGNARAWKSPIVVTTRKRGYAAGTLEKIGFESIEIGELSRVAVRRYVNSFKTLAPADKKKIVDTAHYRTPMVIQALIGIYLNRDAREADVDALSVELVRLLLDPRFSPAWPGAGFPGVGPLLPLASALAFQIRANENRPIPESEASQVLQESLAYDAQGIDATEADVLDFFKRRGLLTVDSGMVDFIHDTVVLPLANRFTGREVTTPARNTLQGSLDELLNFQGSKISHSIAVGYQERHEGGTRELFERSGDFDETWTADFRGVSPEPLPDEPDLGAYLTHFAQSMVRFREQMAVASTQERYALVEEQGQRLLDLIAVLPVEWSNQDVLFGEYVVGLGFFEVAAQVGALFLRDQQATDLTKDIERTVETGTYVDGLQATFDLHRIVLDEIQDYHDPDAGWEAIVAFWEELQPSLRRVLQGIVSLRRVPDENRKQLMSFSQILHWDGWGGDGSTFTKIGGHDALSKTLIACREHCFDWHGRNQQEQSSTAENFKARFRFFGDAARPMKRYAAKCTAALLLYKGFAGEDEPLVKIWGDAVGPTLMAERQIVKEARRLEKRPVANQLTYLDELGSPGYKVLGTEMSGPSLERLLKDRDTDDIQREVGFRDLNQSFPGESEEAPLTDDGIPSNRGTYNCYSCSVALHQIADRTRNHERILEIIGFAVNVVKPGGVLSLPDVGYGAALQVVLLPINLVDREGGWGLDLFVSRPDTGRILTFPAIARSMAGGWFRDDKSPGRRAYKVPLPLVPLALGTPEPAARAGLSMYEFIPYLVIKIRGEQVLALDQAWSEARTFEQLAQVVHRAIGWWKADTPAIAESWLPDVKKLTNIAKRQWASTGAPVYRRWEKEMAAV